MKRALFLIVFGMTSLTPVSMAVEASHPAVKLLWVPTNRTATNVVLKKEFEAEVYGSSILSVKPDLEITTAPFTAGEHPNPFGITDKDFNTGWFLSHPDETQGPVPTIAPADAAWFDELIAKNKIPDVFEVGGHHVISEGWHSDNEHHFLFAPTFIDALNTYPSIRTVFDHVKVAFLWGCNTMTNLEPHGLNGEFLSTSQIKDIYDGSPEGRLRMIGLSKPNGAPLYNSVEFYKQRLNSEYGKNSRRWEYTRIKSEETCKGPYTDCRVTDLERVMPESFLWDGTHRFNEPIRMKQIFRKAYLVLGFSSASPSEERRAFILQTTMDRTRAALNAGKKDTDLSYIRNVLYTIESDDTPTRLRKEVIEEVRKQWTIATNEYNADRPSGSITPAFPDLDKNGVFNVVVSKRTPAYAPYEARNEDGSEITEPAPSENSEENRLD